MAIVLDDIAQNPNVRGHKVAEVDGRWRRRSGGCDRPLSHAPLAIDDQPVMTGRGRTYPHDKTTPGRGRFHHLLPPTSRSTASSTTSMRRYSSAESLDSQIFLALTSAKRPSLDRLRPR